MQENKMCNHNAGEQMSVTMAYVPWQKWSNLYDLNKGFHIGTIFPCLNKPFEECAVNRGGFRGWS